MCWAMAAAQTQKTVMPWMGLERTGEDIGPDLQELVANPSLFSAVSFECYDLSANGTLLRNSVSTVNPILMAAGIQTFPMVSTYSDKPPHRPNTTVEHLRLLFRNPKPFMDAALQQALSLGYAGFNIDFEPENCVATAQDAADYVDFLNHFADALHAAGKALTVDIASWSPLWDFSLLGKSRVDRLMLMDTYAGNNTVWRNALQKALASIPASQLGIGLITINPNTNLPFSDSDLQLRFNAIQKSGVQAIGIWDAPVPKNWFPYLKAFVSAP